MNKRTQLVVFLILTALLIQGVPAATLDLSLYGSWTTSISGSDLNGTWSGTWTKRSQSNVVQLSIYAAYTESWAVCASLDSLPSGVTLQASQVAVGPKGSTIQVVPGTYLNPCTLFFQGTGQILNVGVTYTLNGNMQASAGSATTTVTYTLTAL